MSSVPSTPARDAPAPVHRRVNRVPPWAPIVSAIVLVAGVLAFLIAYDVGGIRNTADVSNPRPSNEPATPVPAKQKTVPLNKDAANVAIRFIDTAVSRKNLAASYNLITADLRGGLTLKEWKTGNIPIAYFPVWARGAGYSPYEIADDGKWSHENEAMLKILLTPRKGEGLKPQQFWIGVKRASAKAPWKVSYFQPYWFPPRPIERD